MASESTADRLRTLADFIEAVEREREGVTVGEYQVPSGTTVATVTLDVDLAEWRSSDASDPTSMYPDEVVRVDGGDGEDDGGEGDSRDETDSDDHEDGLNDQDGSPVSVEELTDLEQWVVEYLDDRGETHSTELCDAHGSETVRHSLSDLHDRGVVDRWRDPDDRRRYLYALTVDIDSSDGIDAPPTDGDDDHSDEESDGTEDGTADADEVLADVDRTADELQDALAGAQSLRTFARDLEVDRDTAATLAGRLGVLEDLAAGGSGVDADQAAAVLGEVTT